jgi:hypothetical protein
VADIFLEDWEGGIGTWTATGTPNVNAGGAIFGALGLEITASAASEYVQKALPASCRMIVGRAYFDVGTPIAVNSTLCLNASGDLRLILNTNRSWSAVVAGGTTQTSAVLSTGPHWIDWMFTCSGATATVDWKIDAVNQTQATHAQTAADMSFFRHGMVGAVTGAIDYDQLRVTDVAGDFPLGPVHYYDPVGAMGVFGA